MRFTKTPGVMIWSGLISPGWHQVLDFGHGDLAGGGHHRIEVARGLSIDQVALAVAHPGVHDREVGNEPTLHDEALAIKFALLLVLSDHGPGAGPGEERRNAGSARANTLSQRSLRIELDLELAREILLRESLVLADIGRDHLLDLPGVEEEAKTNPINARIVGYDREVANPGVPDGLDQRLRDTAKPEAPGHDHHAVLQKAGKCRGSIGIEFFHEPTVLDFAYSWPLLGRGRVRRMRKFCIALRQGLQCLLPEDGQLQSCRPGLRGSRSCS